MSKSSKKPYVVRGFNVNEEGQFDCTGVITKLDTFTELTVDKQHEAVVEMLTNRQLSTMSARKNFADDQDAWINVCPREVYVVDLTIVTTAKKAGDLRSCRTSVREVLKTWAEKCRIRGLRGWRVNAIKTPTFEYDKKEESVVIRTQIILGTAVFYATGQVRVNEPSTSDEESSLRSLAHSASRACPAFVSLKYRHSVIGDGEIF